MIHKLSNGIEIKFSPKILNQITEFCSLQFNRLNGFYIESERRELTPTNAREYAKELTLLADVCDEANKLLNQTKQKTK